MKNIKYLIFTLFIMILFSLNVSAKSYYIYNTQTKAYFYPSNVSQVMEWNKSYTRNPNGDNLYHIYSQFYIFPEYDTTLDHIESGNYLYEFYFYTTGSYDPNFSCSNFKSYDFQVQVDGSYNASYLSSKCVDAYVTTYNGIPAYRVLFSFANSYDNAWDFKFLFTVNLITATNYHYSYGFMPTGIYDFDSTLVSDFKSDKSLQEQVTQNQTIIDQNQEIIDEENETQQKIEEQIQQDKTQHEESETTKKGMWETLKSMLNFINPLSEDFFAYKLVELFLNMLKSLFIPEDMDFVTDFVDALESKLGFIASVPVAIIEFIMSLASATWSEFNSISLPSISVFGYNFWNAQTIDLTEAINIFKPFKYVTDVICVVICAQTLNKWRERFTGGGSGK